MEEESAGNPSYVISGNAAARLIVVHDNLSGESYSVEFGAGDVRKTWDMRLTALGYLAAHVEPGVPIDFEAANQATGIKPFFIKRISSAMPDVFTEHEDKTWTLNGSLEVTDIVVPSEMQELRGRTLTNGLLRMLLGEGKAEKEHKPLLDKLKESQTVVYSINGIEYVLPISERQDDINQSAFTAGYLLELLMIKKQTTLPAIVEDLRSFLSVEDRKQIIGLETETMLMKAVHHLNTLLFIDDQGEHQNLVYVQDGEQEERWVSPGRRAPVEQFIVLNTKAQIEARYYPDMHHSNVEKMLPGAAMRPEATLPFAISDKAMQQSKEINDITLSLEWDESIALALRVLLEEERSISHPAAIQIIDVTVNAMALAAVKQGLAEHGRVMTRSDLYMLRKAAKHSLEEKFYYALGDRVRKTTLSIHNLNQPGRLRNADGFYGQPIKQVNPFWQMVEV